MRLKASKNALSLLASSAAAQAASPAADGAAGDATAGAEPSPSKPRPLVVPDFSALADLGLAPPEPPQQQQQQQPAAQEQQPAQQQQQQPAARAAPAPNQRPQRKRKATAWAEDMIPTDALSRRGPKRPLPTMQQQQQQPDRPALPPGAGLQVAKASTHVGGTAPGLAGPSAALLPALLQRVHNSASPMPYKLVPAPAPGSGSGDGAAPAAAAFLPPAVRVAAPREVAAVAKRLDEEERQKALAAADVRVALRVLPGAQAAGRSGGGAKPAAAPKPGAGRSGRGKRVRGPDGRYYSAGAVIPPKREKTTPEPTQPRLNLPPGTWHPGFESRGGMTVISVLQAPAAPPLPAVATGQPARLREPLLVSHLQAEPLYSDDPLRASLEFLRHAAQTAGRPPHYTSAAAAAVAAQERAHKEHLARAHFARDRRRIARERVEGTRKSVRMRAAPDTFAPPPPPAEPRRAGKARPPRPEDATDVRLGEEYLADLPALRPRPSTPLPEEARFVAHLACKPGDVALPACDPQQAAALPAASAEERTAAVAAAHEALKASLGPHRAAALGLLSCGADALRGLLSEGEEAALEAGMREFGRAFHTIRAELLPGRTPFDLHNYYYNVWKLRATPAAAAWFEERAAEAAAREAEAERAEREAEAEAAAARARLESKYKRRQLREVVAWIRTAARSPLDVPSRPVVAQRAQRAAMLVGGLAAQGAPAAPAAPAEDDAPPKAEPN